MSLKSTLKFTVWAAKSDLNLVVTLDTVIKWQGHPGPTQQDIDIEFDDVEGQHCLAWILSGKTTDHTLIDGSGTITQDLVVEIKNVTVDDISIDGLVWQLARYQHDFNGTGTVTEDRFYGTMGCNGTASLEFTTPIYIWLLENM